MNNKQFNNSFSFLNKNMSKSVSFISLVVALFLFAVSINASSVKVNVHISYPSHHNPINTDTFHDSIANHEILPIEHQSDEAEVDDANDIEIVGSNAPNSNSAESLHINAPDNRKDYTIPSYVEWNINGDLIQYTGSQIESSLNTWGGLNEAVHILKQAVQRLGVNGFLDFQRGGRTGFINHVSYGCYDYRNAIASMMKVLDRNPTLLTDSRRINLDVEHV
jgi:hypothetical protein